MALGDATGQFTGRTVLITGASRNIGRSIATAFARAGADLLVVARGEERLRTVASEIGAESGQQVIVASGDLGTSDGVARILQVVKDTGKSIDVLVNCAADAGSEPSTLEARPYDPGSATAGLNILDIADEVWERRFAVNVLGVYRLTRGIARGMRHEGGGAIVNVVGGTGFIPLRGQAPDGVTKSALWTLTRYLSMELAPEIRVNAVCPGTIAEPDEWRGYARDQVLPDVPMGRVGTPDEVAGAALYLASDASTYTSGALITVNGGRAW